MIKFLKIMLMALPVFVLSSSCVKEDLDDCDNVTIYFQYLADGDTDVLYKYMSKVDLYVFDEGGHIIGVGHYTQDELKNFDAVPSFRLQYGKRYKVVAIGNAYDHTAVENIYADRLSDIYIQSPFWNDDSRNVINHDDNYMGQQEFVMPDQEGVMYRDTVTLYSSHVDTEVEIYGLPAPQSRADIPYELSFENSNAQTSFENEINTEVKGTIYPELVYDAEKNCYHTSDFALFRLDHETSLDETTCAHQLVLKDKNTGVELVRGNILNYLNRYREDIDVTKQEALLPISIVFDQVGVSIRLPEWYVEDIEPDWQ